MFYFQNIIFVLIIIVNTRSSLISGYQQNSDGNSTVRLVQVLFRHGDRTNDVSTTYPCDPHINETYLPYGHGQLTKRGKQRQNMIGTSLLKRYNSFLGDVYTPDIVDVITTEMSRTKMSGQLALAGLFPPKNTALEWDKDLNWQPIPYSYTPFAQDKLLTLSLFYCPNYIKHYNTYLSSPAGRDSQKKYTDLYEYLSNHACKIVNSTLDVYGLFFGLSAEKEWGLELPPWTIKVFPEYMEKAAIEQYIVGSATTKLKQLSGGFLVKRMIENMQLKANNKLLPQGRKIYLYSAHEMNLGYVLNALEVYFPHVPPYGAYLLVELHEINHVHGVKLFYQDYSSLEPKPLKVPGCQHFCPLKEFARILQKNLPTDDNMCGEDLSILREYEHKNRYFPGRYS